MKTTNTLVIAPLLSKSGYGVHARSIVNQLIKKYDFGSLFFNITNWGGTPNYAPNELEHGQLYVQRAQATEQLLKQGQKFDVLIQVGLPNELAEDVAPFKIFSTAAVECTKIVPEWTTALNKCDVIHVPSEFTKQVLFDNGVFKPIIAVGLNTPSEDNRYLEDPRFTEVLDEKFSAYDNVVVTGGLWDLSTSLFEDRKGLDETIYNFILSNKSNDKTALVVKTYSRDAGSAKDEEACKQRINMIGQAARVARKNLPPVVLLHGDLKASQWTEVLRHPKVKAFVTCTHGEGYGLMLAEAMLHGVHVIAPKWSGHLDFINSSNGTLLKNKIVDVSNSFKRTPWGGQPGAKWCTVDLDDFCKAMGKVPKLTRYRDTTVIGKTYSKMINDQVEQFDQYMEYAKLNKWEEVAQQIYDEQTIRYYGTSVVVISDLMPDEGRGAEKTLDEYLRRSNVDATWIRSSEAITLENGPILDGKIILVANASMMSKEAWQYIVNTQKYILCEFDYRWAHRRNPIFAELDPGFAGYDEQYLDQWRQIYARAHNAIWCSEAQRSITCKALNIEKIGVVVGSSFSIEDTPRAAVRSGVAYWNSKDPIKGAPFAKRLISKVFPNVPVYPFDGISASERNELFGKISTVVVSPSAYDVDPRVIYEALACGCRVVFNEYAQNDLNNVANVVDFEPAGLGWKIAEPKSKSDLENESELRLQKFIGVLNELVETATQTNKVSFYTTVFNASANDYPFVKSISSACMAASKLTKQHNIEAEVVVVDLGSTDNTLDQINLGLFDNIRVVKDGFRFDKTKPNWFVDEGKQFARSCCTGQIAIQFDCDEVFNTTDDSISQLADIVSYFPNNPTVVLAIPMVEYWGSDQYVRSDYFPFKPRISRLADMIEHGVPGGALHRVDGHDFIINGAADGCEYIVPSQNNGMAMIVSPILSERIRNLYELNRTAFIKAMFNGTANTIKVDHLSWINITKKINDYRNVWDEAHRAKYGLPMQHNAHFEVKSWSEVTDQMIAARAQFLKENGSKMFHDKFSVREKLYPPIKVVLNDHRSVQN